VVPVTAGISTAGTGQTADERRPRFRWIASHILTIRNLNLLAGLIVLAIVSMSGYALWADHLNTRQEAERSSRNVLTAVVREVSHDLSLLDLSLKGVAEGLQHPELQRLSPDIQHRLLFDRSLSRGTLASLLALNDAGDTIADSNIIALQSQSNYSDRDYFQVHKDNPHPFYVSRPYPRRHMAGEFSIAVSRRLSHSDGSFAGAVVSETAFSNIQALFRDLNVGEKGALSLYRDDGILLMRQPYNTALIGRDQSKDPNIVRALKERYGTFDAQSCLSAATRAKNRPAGDLSSEVQCETAERHPQM
jgi:hypothetical protein